MEGRPIYLIALCVLGVVAGCKQPADLPFEQFALTQPAYTPDNSSGNAYDAYALAAIEVEAKAGRYLSRNYFTPAMKQKAVELVGPALARIERRTGDKVPFEFRPYEPGKSPPYQRGWRLLARGLVWQIEQAVIDGNYDAASAKASQAIAFGFDLVGGGALDASLGLSIVDEARRAVAPALGKMSAEQLGRLEGGVTQALLNRPLLVQALENERKNYALAVQYVQDSFRDGKLDRLLEVLGKDARSAINYLRRLKNEDPAVRVAYFRDFAAEANAEIDWLIEESKLPKYKRSGDREVNQAKERPWRTLARMLFMTGRPLLDMELRTLARTRLLALTASLTRQLRIANEAPGGIAGYPVMIRTDPFSGRPFIYRSAGREFRIYSVGADCRDDGGDSDEASAAPDLVLETRP